MGAGAAGHGGAGDGAAVLAAACRAWFAADGGVRAGDHPVSASWGERQRGGAARRWADGPPGHLGARGSAATDVLGDPWGGGSTAAGGGGCGDACPVWPA